MLSSPESSVVLAEADQQKFELVNRRLSTLQREVLSATKELSTLDDEIISTQKAKKYEEEQLIEVTSKVEALRTEQQELILDVAKSKKELAGHREEYGSHAEKHVSKEKEFADREFLLLSQEKEFAQRALSMDIAGKTLEKDRAEVENARNAFLDAVTAVVWK